MTTPGMESDEQAHLMPDDPPQKLSRLRTTSLTSSQTSLASSPARKAHLRTPSLRERPSSSHTNSAQERIDIIAPVPLRHSALQTPDLTSPRWTRTPSPSSSRAISPASSVYHKSHLSFSTFDSRGKLARVAEDGDKAAELESMGMGRRWIGWMHRHGMRDWILLCAIIGSAWVKWCVGLGSYSGKDTPPMFGDYEAQRHWMEITVHLPIRQWYSYDLQYWGLDYPPLTAYVSWICGSVGSLINPTWFALDKSRGIESEGSKVFMRATVFILDHIVYVPALWMFTRVWHAGRSRRTQNLAFLTLLLQPALLLIDFGHFQYNSVMLGFTLLAVNFFITGQDLLGAFFFVLSLGFKQMALYYAPAIGSYLIGKCLYLGPKDGLQLFIRLAIVTSISFLILFLPFLPPFAPISTILDPITRIFPFDRGIFEDKVANFWCASNVVIKWKFWASRNTLVRISTLLTAVGFVPAAVAPVRAWLRLRGEEPAEGEAKGNKTVPAPQVIHPVLLHALLSSAMSFFLFSFQVHEKTVLLPLMPLSLLLSGAAQGSTAFKLGALVNNVAVFSMWPLLSRDGQAVQYIALLLLWNRLIGHNPFRIQKAELFDLFTLGVYAACFALHILEFVFLPPARYPDLFPVLNVLISTPIFVLTWLWSMKSLIEARWTVGGLGLGTRSRRPSMSDKGHSDIQTPATEDGIAPMIPRGIGREFGLRAQSLGYRSGKRRAPVSRAASVGLAD